MNKYEGLFILDPTVKEDALKASIDKVQDMIKATGGKVHTVQKLETRPFARGGGQRQTGYYVNFIFDAPATAVKELSSRFHLEGGVYRWQFTVRPEEDKKRKKRNKPPEVIARERERERERESSSYQPRDRDSYQR